MTGVHYVAIILTFITGIFFGAFLYITSFAPELATQEAVRTANNWEVIATATGGCQMVENNCGSFSVSSNRSFRYLSGDTMTPKTGKISAAITRELETVLAATDPDELLAGEMSCRAAYDGIDYEYDITYKNERYVVSTCFQNFSGSSLNEALEKVWQELENGPESPVLIEKGLRGFLEQQLKEEFGNQ